MNSICVKFFCVPVEGNYSIPFAEIDFKYKCYNDLQEQIKAYMIKCGFYSNVFYYMDVIPF